MVVADRLRLLLHLPALLRRMLVSTSRSPHCIRCLLPLHMHSILSLLPSFCVLCAQSGLYVPRRRLSSRSPTHSLSMPRPPVLELNSPSPAPPANDYGDRFLISAAVTRLHHWRSLDSCACVDMSVISVWCMRSSVPHALSGEVVEVPARRTGSVPAVQSGVAIQTVIASAYIWNGTGVCTG